MRGTGDLSINSGLSATFQCQVTGRHGTDGRTDGRGATRNKDAVASLGLVSPGAATDGVTLIFF